LFHFRSSENYVFAEIKEREDSHNLPKVIHFIWTGDPIRDQYIDNIQSFVMNTDYQIYLWTDQNTQNALKDPKGFVLKDIDSLSLINSDAVKEETNPGAKSDILRLEVVYQFGGIYLDTDSKCVLRFPKILQRSFVPYVFGGYNNICNCVFGMAKHSGFLKFVLESLKLNWVKPGYRDQDVPGKTGPTFLTSMFVKYHDEEINMIHQDYLCLRSNKSILYQTFDATWGKKR